MLHTALGPVLMRNESRVLVDVNWTPVARGKSLDLDLWPLALAAPSSAVGLMPLGFRLFASSPSWLFSSCAFVFSLMEEFMIVTD